MKNIVLRTLRPDAWEKGIFELFNSNAKTVKKRGKSEKENEEINIKKEDIAESNTFKRKVKKLKSFQKVEKEKDK